ncbi:MAG: ABC transporter ATP-binding protein [Ghiorsea sp.]
MFSVSGVNKSYPTPTGSLLVLDDINLELNEGVFAAIIGESGSGKSTLLQILGTLDHPDSGTMMLEQHALHALNEKDLAALRNQSIGFIYQSHHLIPELTALENVMLPLLIAGKSNAFATQESMTLLDSLGLKARCSHIPAHLSGGEAQRVAVARALINKPKLILADEPTGNLDETTAALVFSMMKDICKSQQVAVIMVTHNRAFADACDTAYELKNHKLSQIK